MKPVKTWILVADSARARVVLNDGPGHGVKPLPGREFVATIPPAHEIVSDRQGRVHDSAGPGRHAMEPPSDTRRVQKQEFIRSLAEVLERARERGKFDRLVIVAPPATLGDLRKVLSSHVRDLVSAEIAKDLTHLPNAELPGHLEDVLAV